jgi:hypothetical protein
MSKNKDTRTFGAKKVLHLLLKGGELFRDLQGRACGTFEFGGKLTTFLVDSKEFRSTLATFSFEKLKSPLMESECDVVVGALSEKAQSMPRREVFVRVGHGEGNIVVDLCLDDGMVVVVEPGKWQTTTKYDIKFRHPKGMLALPAPDARHGDLRTRTGTVF